MKILVRLMLGVSALILLLVAAGFFLPKDYHVERRIVVQAPPEKVFSLLEDPREWRRWNTWSRRDPAMTVSYSGPPRGPGAAWQWQSASQGSGAMQFVRVEQDRVLEYVLDFAGTDTRPTGTFRLQPRAGATEVSWSMRDSVGYNPFMRWMSLLMKKMIGRDFEEGLAALKSVAETDAGNPMP